MGSENDEVQVLAGWATPEEFFNWTIAEADILGVQLMGFEIFFFFFFFFF
jgi:hypothetical protein